MDLATLQISLAVGALVAFLVVTSSIEKRKKKAIDLEWQRLQDKKKERRAQVWRE